MNCYWDNGYDPEPSEEDREDVETNLHAASDAERKMNSNTTDRLLRVAGLAIGFSFVLYVLYFWGR